MENQIRVLTEGKDDTRIQIWIRVRLGGQRMTDVARDSGYQDASSVDRVLQRLDTRANEDRQLARHLRQLQRKADASRVKR